MPSAHPTSSLPKQQTVIRAQGLGKLAIEHDAPIPQLLPDMALIRTAAVAINPVDAKMLDYSGTAGPVAGNDFAGTVVALGEEALKSGNLAVGDRVAGMVFGLNKLRPEIGGFSQYVGATADLLLKIPDHMSFEEAATLGMGVSTALLAIFTELQVPVTLEQLRAADGTAGNEIADAAKFVLVAGGSTATGTRVIQLLKLAGLRPIATCSPANFALVQRFGAEKAFDYRSPTVAADIRAYTNNELAYALDCISLAETTQICYGAIGRAGGRYCSLEPFRETVTKSRALTIEPSWLLALTIFGNKVALDGEYAREAKPEHRKFGAEAYRAVQALLDRGAIEAHPVKALPGGWEGVIEGVDTIRKQAISGVKMVYTVG